MNPFQFRRRDGESSPAARAAGTLAVLIVALLIWLSADPEAHERFHHDAGQEDHHCVITDFASGEGFYLAPQIDLRPAAASLELVSFEAGEILRQPVDYVLLPICGPPFDGLSI